MPKIVRIDQLHTGMLAAATLDCQWQETALHALHCVAEYMKVASRKD
jgi:hypothetical protein